MVFYSFVWYKGELYDNRFGPREAGDGGMRQGATGRRQGGDRKTTGWRQEDDRPAAGKRQGSDRKRQAGDRKATGEVRQEGDRRATGRRQGGDRETTGKRQETRHSDRIRDRKATGRRQEGNRASGDREATGKRQEKATGERKESDGRATGERHKKCVGRETSQAMCDTMTSGFFTCDVCHSNILSGFVPHYGLGLGIQSFLNCAVQSVCS